MHQVPGIMSYHLNVFRLIVLLGILPGVSTDENTFAPSPQAPEDWNIISKVVDEKVTGFLNEVSGIETLQKAYDNAFSSGKITFEPVDGRSLVEEVASSLGELIEKKVKALRASVERAEHLLEKYEWDKGPEEVEYFHVHTLNESLEEFQENSQFNGVVSLDNSSVHIPVDIFKGNADILNAIAWTSGLDEVWKNNKEEDPDLLWQFFGSQTGVLRTYPASKWKRDKSKDFYDVRRSPWYTQGTSSPKDMLILIEKSGSAHGQALELMKHAVKSILDTLGENDFVNMANFSDKVEYTGCFQSFVQATERNKKILALFLDSMTAGAVANYTLGFEFAFQQFADYSNNTNRSGFKSANCNPVIMLLSDGGSQVPVEIFRRYNADKRIRVFSFAVGPITGAEPGSTKQIGCLNRGYFYQIPAMGAIRSKVQGYLNYLSRGIYSNETLPVLWSSLYEDIWGLGLVLSVTMPVFNRSQDSANQTILGVMGVDVSVNELMDVIPKHKLGPTGYAFAINSNGIVLFHPELKLDVGEEDRITSPVVDFAELEEETPERKKKKVPTATLR